jgi:hypothetical protein
MGVTLDLEPLDAEQARSLTDTIRNAVEVIWVLISRAHAGKAWQALGYSSWEEYVRGEFNMSRSRSYQLLDQSRVIAAIEAAVPEGTEVYVSEAAARDLKGALDEVIPEIQARTEGLEPEEAAVAVSEVIQEHRDAAKSPTAVGDDGDDPNITNLPGPMIGGSDGDDDFEDDFDEPTAAPAAGPLLDPAPAAAPAAVNVDAVDVAKIRRNVNAAHDLYSSLSALAGLPDELDEVISIIPAERHAQIEKNLETAKANLERFSALWGGKSGDDEDDAF